MTVETGRKYFSLKIIKAEKESINIFILISFVWREAAAAPLAS